MRESPLLAIAIPFFLLAIAIEYYIGRRQQRELYRFNDSIADLSCGVSQVVSEIFLKGLHLALYWWVFENYRLFTFAETDLTPWILAFLGVDFFYYWWHRLSHEVNFMWAIHVVHHQSEDYNLAVALRQATFSILTSRFFYLPLALMGVSPFILLVNLEISLIYQFWIHTQAIGKMPPWFEAVMNTPAHHRVHHAVNPQYIDRNHAAILIIWDKLFGTFEEEREQPVFGITKPLKSFNPIWANFHYWLELFELAAQTPRFSDKIKLFFMPPGWKPAELGGPEHAPPVDPARVVKYDPKVPKTIRRYIGLQFLLVAPAAPILMEAGKVLSPLNLLLPTLLVFLTVITWSGMMERKRWAVPLEVTRLILLVAGVAAGLWGHSLMLYATLTVLVLAGLFAFWVIRFAPLINSEPARA